MDNGYVVVVREGVQWIDRSLRHVIDDVHETLRPCEPGAISVLCLPRLVVGRLDLAPRNYQSITSAVALRFHAILWYRKGLCYYKQS